LQERKELIQGGFRDKHNAMGSILLGGGVLIAVEGCVNTWMRTSKLFPGPHLFAGAGIVVLWALAAALVPSMQKGDNNARNMHIALNAVNVALFAWQVCAFNSPVWYAPRQRHDSMGKVKMGGGQLLLLGRQHVVQPCLVSAACGAVMLGARVCLHSFDHTVLPLSVTGLSCVSRQQRHITCGCCNQACCCQAALALSHTAAAAAFAAGAHWPGDCGQGVPVHTVALSSSWLRKHGQCSQYSLRNWALAAVTPAARRTSALSVKLPLQLVQIWCCCRLKQA
jgi:hypothetical protein